jgi:hypothetical protein
LDKVLFYQLTFWGHMGIALLVPGMIKARHVRRQNALLHRARALLVIASQQLAQSDKSAALQTLTRMERLEAVWRLGNCRFYRAALASSAVLAAFVPSMAIRITGDYTIGLLKDGLSSGALLILGVQSSCCVWAVICAWCETWTPPELVDNCAERLRGWIAAGQNVAEIPLRPEAKAPEVSAAPLTAKELLGLGRSYTRKELDAARRRMALRIHPDLGPASEREVRGRAMRELNSVYDELLPSASR